MRSEEQIVQGGFVTRRHPDESPAAAGEQIVDDPLAGHRVLAAEQPAELRDYGIGRGAAPAQRLRNSIETLHNPGDRAGEPAIGEQFVAGPTKHGRDAGAVSGHFLESAVQRGPERLDPLHRHVEGARHLAGARLLAFSQRRQPDGRIGTIRWTRRAKQFIRYFFETF